MTRIDRRRLMIGVGTLAGGLAAADFGYAQGPNQADANGERRLFGFDDVVAQAQKLAGLPFDNSIPKRPIEFEGMDWDKWRQIRFRPEKALLRGGGSRFSLQAFHLGHLFNRPVTINIAREGIFSPIPYSTDLFDYGSMKLPRKLPIDLGFAGFRIHYPLNDPNTNDELISFVGSSYFRWLGRGQKYGLSARALAIGTGKLDNNEEFPFFREFWVDAHDGKSEQLTIFALLDSASVAGAYQFVVQPGQHSSVDVTARLFARKAIERLGIAPLTSMYFLGENDRHLNDRNKYDEFRPELHDSDGLLMHRGGGDWAWRPLKNPLVQEVQHFDAAGGKGFGLMQRDRRFESYQDIELNYESRPSYWIEPTNDWGNGVVELVELATKDETADNIITAFVPLVPLEAGKELNLTYRMLALDDGLELHSLGYVAHTFSAPARALGSNELENNMTRRLIVDFTGGDLAYFTKELGLVKVETSAVDATVLKTYLVSNPAISGIRVMIDVEFVKDKVGVLGALLQSNGRALTETWSYAWRIYNF